MKDLLHTGMLCICILFITTNCSPKIRIISTDPPVVYEMEPIPNILYYVDSDIDGVYENLIPEEEPKPIIGKEEFRRAFNRSIWYPNMAKEYSTEGIVILEVTVDERGLVQDVKIKKNLENGCGEEARRAFILFSHNGYAPLKFNSEFIKYKMDFPAVFWLH